MKYESSFNSFYSDICNKYEDAIKENKKRGIKHIIIHLVISISLILGTYLITRNTDYIYIVPVIGIILFFFLLAIVVKNSIPNNNIGMEIQNQMWNSLFHEYRKTEPNKRDSVKSDLVRTRYLVLECPNYIRTINEKNIECKTIEEYSTDGDGDRYTSFHGFIITITGIKNPYKCIYKYKHLFYEEKEINKVLTESLNKYKTYTNENLNGNLVEKLREYEENDLLHADIYEDKNKTIIFVSTMDTLLRGTTKKKVIEKAYKKIFYINDLIEFICK